MLNPEAHLTYASSLSPPVDAKAKKRAYDAAYRATHKAELATKWAAYDAAHRAERRAYAAVYLYGITLNQKTAILKEQGEACAICGTTEPGTKGWHTDHKHGTKIVRGILCRACNLTLGYMNDNPATLRAAAIYLEKAEVVRLGQSPVTPSYGW